MEKPVVEVATDQSPPFELVAEDIAVGEGDEACKSTHSRHLDEIR